MKTEKRKTGDLGEEIACRFLRNKGYKILDRNYLKKWGEIDIISENKDILHFVEVKTVRRGSPQAISRENPSNQANSEERLLSREIGYRPEENVHPKKLERMYRTIESYLEEQKISRESDWQVDIVAVELNETTKEARVRFLENVI